MNIILMIMMWKRRTRNEEIIYQLPDERQNRGKHQKEHGKKCTRLPK